MENIPFKRADKDLSVDYVSRIQKEKGHDTVKNALKDATLLTEEDIGALGYKEGKRLYTFIIDNTFDEQEEGEDSGDEKK